MGHLSVLLLIGVAVSSVCSQYSGESGSDIGIQVFDQIAKSRPQDNLVMSPHGIANVLGMLQLGAEGKTKKQLVTAMRYNVNGSSKMLKRVQKSLASGKNKDLVTIANAMFAQSGFKMEDAFVSSNREVFRCESRSLNFNDPNHAAASVNHWVANRTRGMIENLVSPDMLSSALTRLVAVNAIYFKGMWKSRFQPSNTKKRNFNGGDGQVHQVPMMSQLSVFNIGSTSTPDGLEYTVIELPYHGNSMSMLIALPMEDSTPLSAIIPHISTKTIQSWMERMRQRKVRLVIPKFTAEAETDLKAPLLALGITDMFDQDKANFRSITKSEQLSVSKALQKARIEVNEDGTKASAATAAILLARSSPPWVIVDRPFLFFVRHNPTGTVLFMGQINKP
ncbi:glia-derived nexin-like [Acipenser oxyrinchus oxyrinchus]|uniref:Glia-derived nexin-like n=1 Tax=Acipenser oxyrinchus oxyrinchus TaxID=40147 RepID=A0AAD8G3B0_ACIOX|nr:glia-derived nexin-like [Acipenser oxyrinchus oxyrinchus]